MENKPNYTLVGLFVVLLTTALVASVLWLSSAGDKKHYLIYLMRTQESVSGLAPQASVSFQGVEVGKVQSIVLDPNLPGNVLIYLKIQEGTPIHEDTQAVLVSRGITGLVAIELRGGQLDSPILQPSAFNQIPTIRTGASLQRRLDEAFDRFATTFDGVSVSVEKVLSPENISSFSNTLKNIEAISDNIRKGSDDLTSIISNAREISGNVKTLSSTITTEFLTGNTNGKGKYDLEPILAQLRSSLTEFIQMTKSVTQTSDSLRTLSNQAVRHLNEATPQFTEMSKEVRNAANQLEIFTNNLNRDPQLLLKGRGKGKPGPGELGK